MATADRKVTCGDVIAIYRPKLVDGIPTYNLRFEHQGKKSKWLELQNRVEDFDLFSPDCSRVMLLKSRYGPVDVVSVKRLDAYLHGAKPDFVLTGDRSTDGITSTGVFRDGSWLSNDEVAYTWGCCDPPITTTYTLSTGKKRRQFAPSEAH